MESKFKQLRERAIFLERVFFKGYLAKWLPISVTVGLAAGFTAIIFYEMLKHSTSLLLEGFAGYSPPAPAGEGETAFKFSDNPYLIPLVTSLGGLISGLLVYLFAPEAEGHGTDAAIDAFHNKRGEIRIRVPFIKMIASAVTIGSGGSAGREGPIALTSAGVGSMLGKIFRVSERDKRIILAVGMGAGIGAIFKAPFGGAILAAEILYIRDFEIEVLVPAFIASVISYSVFSSVYGWQPIFRTIDWHPYINIFDLIIYGFLGILCGLIGIVYVKSFYGTKSLFDKMNIPRIFKPAIGGLILGLIGILVPQVLGTGYGWLQKIIDGDFSAFTSIPLLFITVLIFLKIIATSLSIGSGGSGGVFAPALVIGGMIGASTWLFFKSIGVTIDPSPASYVIVGMMSFFGGVGKAPIAVILMVSEMTGSYSLMVPSMLSTAIAYVITGKNTIYVSQVLTRSDSPAHMSEYAIPLLTKIRVKDVMTRDLVTISPNATAKEAAELMAKHEIKGLPVVQDGELVGIVAFSDILRVPAEKRNTIKVGELMSRDILTTYPDESIFQAFEKMIHYQVGRLPVVEALGSRRIIGIITRSDIGRIYELKMNQLILEKSEETY